MKNSSVDYWFILQIEPIILQKIYEKFLFFFGSFYKKDTNAQYRLIKHTLVCFGSVHFWFIFGSTELKNKVSYWFSSVHPPLRGCTNEPKTKLFRVRAVCCEVLR